MQNRLKPINPASLDGYNPEKLEALRSRAQHDIFPANTPVMARLQAPLAGGTRQGHAECSWV